MEVVRVLREIRSLGLDRKAFCESWLETHRGPNGFEVAGGSPVQVDPQQLALADPARHPRREFDLAVMPIGVIEAGARSAAARAGGGDQWMTARRTATRAATNAVAYWSTSIDRSTCSPTGGSITPA